MADTQPTEDLRLHELLNCTGFNLRKATRSITQLYNTALAPTKLLITQFSILAILAAYNPCSIKLCSEELGMDPTTLSRNLRPLERRQLVQRSIDMEDQRAQVLELTAQGRQALQEAQPYWQAAQTQVISTMGEDNWQHLLFNLRLLAEMKDR
ncbi:hypothetical protein KDH_10830 [Dictyobacter sp. S3.2.2.5]|uniref:HTH marR-type domain-containing protein n=1 Tax=Dictyobacter halimunensis TaxID=3026934 RepID=A0ABQ6FJA1_9CHLR|nr:hypothetical protein KDH_10830 [Dictyobacter sp. S3.2.2.5]